MNELETLNQIAYTLQVIHETLREHLVVAKETKTVLDNMDNSLTNIDSQTYAIETKKG